MGARRQGRILAFQALYAWGTAGPTGSAGPAGSDGTESAEPGRDLSTLLEFPWLEDDKKEKLGEGADFPRLLVQGTVENIGRVDKMIKRHLKNWDFSRLNQVDRALLRLGAYTLMFQDTPPSVVIDEAVSIAREFGTDDSYRFINGVLDGIRITLQEGAK